MNFFLKILALILFSFHLHAGKIAVVTMAIGSQYKDAVNAGIINKQLYCKKHGYDFYCLSESLDASRPIPWSKILVVQNTLKNKKYDWVFWTDADALIMNDEIALEDIIDNDFNLIICKAHEINSGQFLIKNCRWSHDFLNAVYARTEYINHPWWEQRAIMDVRHEVRFRPFIK